MVFNFFIKFIFLFVFVSRKLSSLKLSGLRSHPFLLIASLSKSFKHCFQLFNSLQYIFFLLSVPPNHFLDLLCVILDLIHLFVLFLHLLKLVQHWLRLQFIFNWLSVEKILGAKPVRLPSSIDDLVFVYHI